MAKYKLFKYSNNHILRCVIIIFGLIGNGSVFSQKVDSTQQSLNIIRQSKFDSTSHASKRQSINRVIVKDSLLFHSPKKAVLLSSACPGLGQIYNKAYWKVPLIYIGFAALAYETYYLNNKYLLYRTLYNEAKTNKNKTVIYKNQEYSAENMREGRDYYRKYTDLCYIGFTLWHIINIVDANVDAHFFDYDISDDLSLHIKPNFYFSTQQNPNVSFSLAIKF